MHRLVVVIPLVVALGCASESGDQRGFDAAFSCDGLADRWAALQQTALDEIGDAEQLDPPTGTVTGALARLGAALSEQARDVESAGCADTLASGSPALCAHVGGLVASGSAGRSLVDALEASCDGAPAP